MAIQNRRGAYTDFDPSLMLPGEYAIVLSGDPSDADGYAIYMCFASGVVKRLVFADQLEDGLDEKQDELTFDSTPTTGSANPVTSAGIASALALKQANLAFDNTPTANSTNPVTSAGIKTALDTKQANLTFDSTPTANSSNPVTSGGVKAALDTKQAELTFDTEPTSNSQNPVTSGGLYTITSDFDAKFKARIPEFVSSQYSYGDIRAYGNKVYKYIGTGTGFEFNWDSTKWEEIVVAQYLSGTTASIATPFSTSSTYAVGDYVVYNSYLFRCKTAVTTAGAWSPTHWERITLVSAANRITDDAIGHVVDSWSANGIYSCGDIVFHDGKVYICISSDAEMSQTFNPSAFEQLSLSELLEHCASSIVPPWDGTSSYSVGNLVMYKNYLYKCTTATVADEGWVAAHWQRTTVRNELTNKQDNITISGTGLIIS